MTRWSFAALAVAAGIFAGWYMNPLIGVCVAFLLMPPSLDPAVRLKEWLMHKELEEEPKPGCFGDWPNYNPQDAAERDCRHCEHGHECFEETPYRKP